MFARCWLLVEGESEAWLLPELARLCGYELAQEGIALVEYAQAGLDPAIRTADGLGIEWHVLTDGDEAGEIYRALAESHAGDDPPALRVTALEEPDLELFLWHHGYDEVYKAVSKVGPLSSAAMTPRRIIRRAIDQASKPMLALEVLSAIAERGEEGVPEPLRQLIETCVTLARRRRPAWRRGRLLPRRAAANAVSSSAARSSSAFCLLVAARSHGPGRTPSRCRQRRPRRDEQFAAEPLQLRLQVPGACPLRAEPGHSSPPRGPAPARPRRGMRGRAGRGSTCSGASVESPRSSSIAVFMASIASRSPRRARDQWRRNSAHVSSSGTARPSRGSRPPRRSSAREGSSSSSWLTIAP